jgi:hypothetical protein
MASRICQARSRAHPTHSVADAHWDHARRKSNPAKQTPWANQAIIIIGQNASRKGYLERKNTDITN